MKDGELDLLMSSVLDGEASQAETLLLGTLLANDPAARKRFDAARWLHHELARVPQEAPPAGFADSVMARLPHPAPHPGGLTPQLFWKSLVLGMRSQTPRPAPGPATDPRAFAPGPLSGERDMSENKSKRNFWIGGGLAAAAAVIGIAQFTDFPSSGESTAGTIAPAQRYRAPQPGAGDVKLGTPTQGGPQQQQQVGVAGASNQAASNNSSMNAVNRAADQTSNDARAAARNQAAGQMANDAAANNSSMNAVNRAADQASNDARAAARNQAAGQVANEAANKAAANNSSMNAVNRAAGQAANDAANRAAGQVANEAMKK